MTIGENVQIGSGSFIRAEGGLVIGDNVVISRNLVLHTRSHDYGGSHLPYGETMKANPVTIGANVWIGMNVTISPGTTIGEGAIVGLGTRVHGDIPPCAIVGAAGWSRIGTRDLAHYEMLKAKQAYRKAGRR
jgi:acetyltransferase-like isoleucine patch superfamily enzyme